MDGAGCGTECSLPYAGYTGWKNVRKGKPNAMRHWYYYAGPKMSYIISKHVNYQTINDENPELYDVFRSPIAHLKTKEKKKKKRTKKNKKGLTVFVCFVCFKLL